MTPAHDEPTPSEGATPAPGGWRPVSFTTLAGLVALASVFLAWLTGGLGATLWVIVASIIGHRLLTRRSRRHPVRAIAAGALPALAAWTLVSVVVAVAPDNGDRFASRLATWARDHRLGAVIDQLEAWTYSEPPSAEPATDLAVTPVTPAPTTSTTAAGADET